MGNLVKYGSYDLDQASKEKEELEQSGGADFLKLKNGRNVVRILPPPVGERSPFRVVYQHFIELPGKKQSVICARVEAKKPCFVCKKIDELRKSPAKADQDAASDLFARRRVFANVIDRNDEDKGPQVMAFGKTVHEQLVELRTNEDACGDFCHPEEGYDLTIIKSGSGKNDTKYKVLPHKHTTPLASSVEQMQEWIDTQPDLNRFARLPDQEEVEQMMESEGEDEAPARTQTTRRLPPKGSTGGGRTTKTRTAEDDAIDVEGEEAEADAED